VQAKEEVEAKMTRPIYNSTDSWNKASVKKLRTTQFIDRVIKVNEQGQPFKLQPHQRTVMDLEDEYMERDCNTSIYGAIKKSGKTTVQASKLLKWGYTHPYDEILLAANDFDQSLGRVFKVMCALIRHNPVLRDEAKVMADKIIFNNGTVVSVIANDAPGEAGANQGASGWDELWGFTSERSLRLWEELTPLPNKPSVRFISTYAGWENESKLLWDLYVLSVDKDEHPEGKAERIHPELPIYVNREAGIFCYWDHEPRMPWQTPSYYALQKKTLRPGTYLRLHENRWTSAESAFISGEMWDSIVDLTHRPILAGASVHIALDVGVKSDSSAVVGVSLIGNKLVIAFHKIWTPTKNQPVMLDDIKAFIVEMFQRHNVRSAVADPSQAFMLMQQLAQEGIIVTEFPQTTNNTIRMGETLFAAIRDRNLVAYKSDEMREHMLNATGLETANGVRMIKGKSTKKIDAAIALAMASVAAIQAGPGGTLDDIATAGERVVSDYSWWREFGDSTSPGKFWDS
jgi:hypothetical protein